MTELERKLEELKGIFVSGITFNVAHMSIHSENRFTITDNHYLDIYDPHICVFRKDNIHGCAERNDIGIIATVYYYERVAIIIDDQSELTKIRKMLYDKD